MHCIVTKLITECIDVIVLDLSLFRTARYPAAGQQWSLRTRQFSICVQRTYTVYFLLFAKYKPVFNGSYRNFGHWGVPDRKCRRHSIRWSPVSIKKLMYFVGTFCLSLAVQKLFHVLHLAGNFYRGPKIGVVWRFWTPNRDLTVMHPKALHYADRVF